MKACVNDQQRKSNENLEQNKTQHCWETTQSQ